MSENSDTYIESEEDQDSEIIILENYSISSSSSESSDCEKQNNKGGATATKSKTSHLANQVTVPVLSNETLRPPPKKKRKYLASFQDNWTQKPQYKDWLEKLDLYSARCRLCGINFVIKYDGEKALKTHENSKNHRQLINSKNHSKLITAFAPPTNSTNQKRTTSSELAMVYHAIRHQHSYNSTECGIKLCTKIYADSNIASSVHCGRTKATSYAENVLGVKAIEIAIQELNTDPPRYFSISTDASNRGNIKLFPIIATYFIPEEGIKHKLIDFYSDDYETSAAITNKITSCLDSFNLSVKNVTAFSADNANVNYGQHNSVFVKLRQLNPHLIKANCNCHVLHNSAKQACKALSIDIETLANKIF